MRCRLGLVLVLATALSMVACESADHGSDTGYDPGQTSDPGPLQDPGHLNDPGQPQDPGAPLDSGNDIDAITGATKLWLESTHSGWKKAGCWGDGCHADDGHRDGLDPYLCVQCHGTNGASARPDGHQGYATCAGCHPTPTDHPSEGFPSPISCKGCHT